MRLRRTTALVVFVAAALVAGMASPGAAAVRPSLGDELAHYATTRADSFSVGVFDEVRHRVYWLRSDVAYDNGSIVKVNVLETLLWQVTRAHRGLTPWEAQQSALMIRQSGNGAATAL